MADLAQGEILDFGERAQKQLERLQATLNRAYRWVPFYQNRFSAGGIDPADIQSLDDLDRIPFTGRQHLVENYPYGLFAVPLRDIVRIHTAPGIGINPSVSGYTATDLQAWQRIVARALTAAGMDAEDILQVHLDPGLANWGRDYKQGAEELQASVIPLTALPADKQVMILTDYKTSVLLTSVSLAGQIATHLYRTGRNPNELALRTLILVGEPVSVDKRRELEEQLRVTTWMHYGLSEVPGPAVAFECHRHDGLHVSEDYFYPEIVDPETGKRSLPGDAGELVLTTLTTRAFPLIRFRTGDRVRLIGDSCPCGRTLRRIEWLDGRTDDTLIVRGVKVHTRQVLAYVEKALGYVPAGFELAPAAEGRTEALEVSLGMDNTMFSDEIKRLENVINTVRGALYQELGLPVRVHLKERQSFME
ncbi:MAG: phenylacetate--CoA ligase family protein [Desulfatibacillaceae bacterium]